MKTVVVIGAGKGMGSSISRRFAMEGFRVVLVARRKESLEAVVARLAQAGIKAFGETADSANPCSLTDALDRIEARFGVPDVLVYNAAFMTGGKVDEISPEEMLAHFKTDVVGALVAAKAFIPQMRQRGSGAIIFTGGLFGVHPNANPDFACMSMDKSALRSLALMLNHELKNTGVFAGIVNIMGGVNSSEQFSADALADAYWRLYRGQNDFEIYCPESDPA